MYSTFSIESYSDFVILVVSANSTGGGRSHFPEGKDIFRQFFISSKYGINTSQYQPDAFLWP